MIQKDPVGAVLVVGGGVGGMRAAIDPTEGIRASTPWKPPKE